MRSELGASPRTSAPAVVALATITLALHAKNFIRVMASPGQRLARSIRHAGAATCVARYPLNLATCIRIVVGKHPPYMTNAANRPPRAANHAICIPMTDSHLATPHHPHLRPAHHCHCAQSAVATAHVQPAQHRPTRTRTATPVHFSSATRTAQRAMVAGANPCPRARGSCQIEPRTVSELVTAVVACAVPVSRRRHRGTAAPSRTSRRPVEGRAVARARTAPRGA